MSMSRRDFEAIATCVNNMYLKSVDKELVTADLSSTLATLNPNFDKQKFINWCLKENDNESA